MNRIDDRKIFSANGPFRQNKDKMIGVNINQIYHKSNLVEIYHHSDRNSLDQLDHRNLNRIDWIKSN